MSKNIFLILFLITIITTLSFFVGSSDDFFSPKTNLFSSLTNGDVSLLFVGDIMLSRYIGELIEQTNPNFPYQNIVKEIKGADIIFGNLENPISNLGTDTGKKYSFRADPNVVSGLKWAGFNVVSLANNHILDWGSEAMFNTMEILDDSEIKYIGVGQNPMKSREPAIFNINGVNVYLLAYSQFSPLHLSSLAISHINSDLISEDIKNALSNGADIVVLSFHWGDEYETTHNNFQEEIAKKTIDSGAHIIIGHHPHVVQEVEFYKNGLIAYSLGNFIFDQNFSEETRKGLVLEVVVDSYGIKEVERKDISFNESFQPFVEKSYNITK